MKKKMCIALCLVLALLLAGCAPAALDPATITNPSNGDLMTGITPVAHTDTVLTEDFIQAQADLSVRLLQESYGAENLLLSPLSIQLALAMTANGADGDTLAQMEKVLGGGMPLSQLNENLKNYTNWLAEDSGLEIANGIWLREGKSVQEAFLQANADYYGAAVREAPFDDTTLAEINQFVSEHTDGQIPEMLSELDPNTVLCLINALTFEGAWEVPYEPPEVREELFTTEKGISRMVSMMPSIEGTYLADDKATGFVKAYEGGRYAFAALLPNKGVDLAEYVSGLTGASLLETLKNAQKQPISCAMPQYSGDSEASLVEILEKLGMGNAFDPEKADFSRLNGTGGLSISEVLHKTHIDIDTAGTKAAASTAVLIDECAAEVEEELVSVILDRPYLYMIVDQLTNLPVFLGVVLDPDPQGEVWIDDEHAPNPESETVPHEPVGYCGNTMTAITPLLPKGEAVCFDGDASVNLTDLLRFLDYDPNQVCRCPGEYQVEIEAGEDEEHLYWLNLTEGFARCNKGQVALSQEQLDLVREIVENQVG